MFDSRHTTALALGLWALLALAPAGAADVPTPSVVPQASQIVPLRELPGAGQGQPDMGSQPPPPRELGKPEGELTIDVDRYELPADAPAALRAALPRLTAPYVGKHRDFEDLQDAARAVARFMQRDLGLYLGYAYIPEQVQHDHVVRIAILLGRLDHVELVWDDHIAVRKQVVQAYLDRLRPGEVLTVRDVERTVFLISDLYGIRLRTDIRPGSRPGTATLVFRPTSEPRVHSRVTFDANGSRFIGVNRLSALLTVASPFGRGDGLSLSGMQSTTGGLRFGLIGYTTPVGGSGLKLGAALSALDYQIDEQLFPLGYSGQAQTANLFALYPLVRSRNLNLFALAAVDDKRYTDRVSVLETKKTVRDLNLEISGDFRDDWLTGGINTFQFGAQQGTVGFEGGTPAGNDDAPRYLKLDFGYSRLQNLVAGRLQAYVATHGQIALDNLDTSEQFRAGGPDGVRAFAPGEGAGDSGLLVSTELRWLPPATMFGKRSREMAFALFFDAARVQLRHNPDLIPRSLTYTNYASYQGVGVALFMSSPGVYSMRLSLAQPLRGTTTADTATRRPRVYFEFSRMF